MNRSSFIAIIVALVVAAWLLSGQLGSSTTGSSENTTSQQADKSTNTDAITVMKVQTKRQSAEEITREIVIQGQVEPLRVLHLRAETAGSVQTKHANKGQTLQAGDPILDFAIDSREADLAVAKANQVQAGNEYEAARKLQQQGLQSQFNLESAAARLEAAKAQVMAATLEIDNTRMVAPFSGLLEDLRVEQGDFIDRGGDIGTLVDHSKLLITGHVPQQNISAVSAGQLANAELITGETVTGEVHYVSSMADSQTRSFRVEILVANPPSKAMTGVSAEIHIPTEKLHAHLVSTAILALSDDGDLGIKAVDDNSQVVFYPVDVIKTESNGAWVTGIPDEVDVITLGQGFVRPGETVQAVTDPDA